MATLIKSSNIDNLAVTHDKLHTDMDLTTKTVQVATPTANSHPATKDYVDTEVANLIDSAPGALDTLNELAAAIGDDANFAATISTNIGTKVDKINITGATVGSASQVPVITFNSQGQITSASATAVAGVSSTAYDTSTGVLTINTSDGGSFTEDLGVGTADSPTFAGLTANGVIESIRSNYAKVRLNSTTPNNTWVVENSNGKLAFTEENVGAHMHIDQGGNVGIGTDSPAGIFQVGSDAGGNFIVGNDATSTNNRHNNTDYIATFQRDSNAFVQISSGNNSSNTGIKFMGAGDRGSVYGTGGYDIHIEPNCANGNGNVIIKGKNDSTYQTKVGIGTANPTKKLDIRGGDVTIYGGVDGYNADSEEVRLWMGNNNAHIGAMFNYGLFFDPGNSAGKALMIRQTTGYVGINDITPSYHLDVNGTIRATGDVIADSDIRLKSNINTITNAVDTVKSLRGTSYIKDDKPNIGLIAQEVEEVMPFMVSTASDEMGTKSVNYQNMVALLIEAMKEQQEQIDELKKMLEVK